MLRGGLFVRAKLPAFPPGRREVEWREEEASWNNLLASLDAEKRLLAEESERRIGKEVAEGKESSGSQPRCKHASLEAKWVSFISSNLKKDEKSFLRGLRGAGRNAQTGWGMIENHLDSTGQELTIFMKNYHSLLKKSHYLHYLTITMVF